MLEAILSTLSIMGWLGIILAILVVVNTVCGTVFNISEKKEEIKKPLKYNNMYRNCRSTFIIFIILGLLSSI